MQIRRLIFTTLLGLGIAVTLTINQGWAQEKAATATPAQKPVIAKQCANCHKPAEGSLRGTFDGVAPKANSIQLSIDDTIEILKFNKESLKVVTADKTAGLEGLKDVKRGKEIRVEYAEKDGVKTATLVSVKPAIKVAPEKMMSTAEVEKLVAMGPEKGKYMLIDARPAPRFQEGAIPTAVNIPFPAFEKNIEKLPKDKNALIIYYCAGVT